MVAKARMKFGTLVLAALLAGGCLGGYNRPMQLIYDVGPKYPPTAKADKIEGQVTLKYDISVDGVVHNVAVVQADPPGVFDQAAKDAVAQWRYKAPILDGVSQSVTGVVSTLKFVLSSGAYTDY
jgi:protein TonB